MAYLKILRQKSYFIFKYVFSDFVSPNKILKYIFLFQNESEAILKIKESMQEEAKRFEKESDGGGGSGGAPSTPGSGGGAIGANGGGPGGGPTDYYMQ